jgi:hypothetical protein
MAPDTPPSSSIAPRNGNKPTARVASFFANLRCCTCGELMSFEDAPTIQQAIEQRYVVGACAKRACKMQSVRLKVPVRTIECEIL